MRPGYTMDRSLDHGLRSDKVVKRRVNLAEIPPKLVSVEDGIILLRRRVFVDRYMISSFIGSGGQSYPAKPNERP
jgi:hypothetical protein